MKKDDIYLLLWSINGVGSKTINKIEEHVGNIEYFLDISEKDIYEIKNINLNTKKNIVKYKSCHYLEEIKEKLNKNNINYMTIDNESYPIKLKNIHNPPHVLFYKGNIDILNEMSIAVVGSRKPTPYGVWASKNLSEQLSNANINVVSGLALGVDYYSHVGCIKGKAKTIAVLGSSVDKPYPKQNEHLAKYILDDGGLIISEYNLDTQVAPSNFPMRNRIISGISDGVLVIEAGEKSGSLITVDFALEQGKNVFALPGNINSAMSKGCHKIIKEGAKLIDNVEDIINEYNLFYNSKLAKKKVENIGLSSEETMILDTLTQYGNVHIDQICDYTNLNIKNVCGILNILEIKGIVTEFKNKIYSINLQ
jgi:DNA processing protein